jgi:hypothetical protein
VTPADYGYVFYLGAHMQIGDTTLFPLGHPVPAGSVREE